jgi:serine/threonine protein phosphatase PrpC
MLRARREFLNSAESPQVLCLKPNARFKAREQTVQVNPDSMLLAMTDGFYRIVDTYGIRTNEQLADVCMQGDLKSVVDELRDFETANLGCAGLSVKSSDDASAVTWRSSRASARPSHT